MQDRPHVGPIDYERLGGYLQALGIPTRIQLLHKLQTPQCLADIHLPAHRKHADKNPERPISRQAVDGHLKKLEAVGLVAWRPIERNGRTVKEYYVNHPRLFVVADEMRRLSLIRPAMQAVDEVTRPAYDADLTGVLDFDANARLPDGPCLVFASGPREGKAIVLDGDGPWSIGRGRDAHVTLDHDPFISHINTEVFRDKAAWFVRDIAEARNGTTHNWVRLEPGGAEPLVAGDTIGVGRTLLVARGF